MGSLQRTLALIKPETFCHVPIYRAVIDRIFSEQFRVLAARKLQMSKFDARKFYRCHEGKFFHGRLVHHMTSGPIAALILERPDAINHWRTLLGPTKVYKSVYDSPNSLRGLYGLSDTRNVGHGCDSEKTMKEEIELFFEERDLDFTNSLSQENVINLALS